MTTSRQNTAYSQHNSTTDN